MPIGEFFSLFTFGIDIESLKPILSPLSVVERILMKIIMYLFILDMKFSSAGKLSTIGTGVESKLSGLPINSVTQSTFALISLKDVDVEESLVWMSSISLLSLMMLEFLFTFLNIVTEIDLNNILNFVISVGVWGLVAYKILRNWMKK